MLNKDSNSYFMSKVKSAAFDEETEREREFRSHIWHWNIEQRRLFDTVFTRRV